MRKIFLLVFLFLFIIQGLYSIELLEIVDGVQKRINIRRFSFFEIKHDYTDWLKLENQNPFLPEKEDIIPEYIKQKIISIQSGESKYGEDSHKLLLEKVVS